MQKFLATLVLVDFSKRFDSLNLGNMKQILVAYDVSKEAVTAIMMLYKNTKAMVRSPDGDIYFFGVVAEILQGDIFARYNFIICQDLVL